MFTKNSLMNPHQSGKQIGSRSSPHFVGPDLGPISCQTTLAGKESIEMIYIYINVVLYCMFVNHETLLSKKIHAFCYK